MSARTCSAGASASDRAPGAGSSAGRRDRVEPEAAHGPVAHGRGQQPPPGEAMGQHPFRAERLRPPGDDVARAAHGESRERRQRPLGVLEPRDPAPLLPAHAVPAPQPQHGGELEQAAHVDEVVHAPHPDPLARIAAHRGDALAQRGHQVGAVVAERGRPVLDVVVERAVDVPDRPGRARDHAEPVVVEVRELPGRERQRVVEQVAREQRGGPGDGVRDEQGAEIVVVVAAPSPVGL